GFRAARQSRATRGPKISPSPDRRSVRRQIEEEIGSDGAKLPQRARLELAHPLSCDAEPLPHLFERLRILAAEPEAKLHHPAHPRVQMAQRLRELLVTEVDRGALLRPVALRVLDQVAVQRLAVADRGLEADRVLDEVEELLHPLLW